MTERLDGKVAVVTGGSSGIGAETAKLFAQNGAAVVLVAREEKKLSAALNEIRALGGKAVAVSADVGVWEDCERVVNESVRQLGHLDVLVNNAGMADKHRHPIRRQGHPLQKCLVIAAVIADEFFAGKLRCFDILFLGQRVIAVASLLRVGMKRFHGGRYFIQRGLNMV